MATSGSFSTSGYSDPGYTDHYVFSWWISGSQSISGNYTDVGWKLQGAGGTNSSYNTCVKQKYCTVNGTTQSNSDLVWTDNDTIAFSGTTRIYHGSDGKASFSASAGGAFYYYGSYNSTGSGSWSLPDIPRQATITSAPNFNDESNPIISYSNPAGTAVTELVASIYDTTGYICYAGYRAISKTGTAYTFNLTTAERNALRNACTSSKSMSIKFYIRTTIGGTYYYSSSEKTLSIVNANPTFTASKVTYADTNTAITAVTGNNQLIVQNKSTLRVSYTAATFLKGATLKQYSFTLNGVTKTSTASSGYVDFGTVNADANLTLTASAIDSRGNTTSATKTISMIAYSKPVITEYSLARQSTATTVIATVKGTICPVNNGNAKSVKVTIGSQTKTATLSSYTVNQQLTFTSVPTDETLTTTAWILDSFSSDVSKTAVLPTVEVTADVRYTGKGIAFGKVSEKDTFECNMQLDPLKDIYMGGNKNQEVERAIHFSNPTTSIYPHDSGLYGGNGDSGTALGLWDYKNTRAVWLYDDANNVLQLGNATTKVRINSDVIADVVVSQGTSGSWTYRKWASGKAEAWQKDFLFTFSNSGAWSGTLYLTSKAFTIPSGIFSEIPQVNCTPSGFGWVWVCNGAYATSKTAGTIYGLRNRTNADNMYANLYLVGVWK